MCIICTAAKKRYIKREEVLESMRVNSSGFFMAALHPDGTRNTIRTLDDKDAIRFFDEQVKEEDAFVMHARIPSRGAKTLDNVHGWEEDRIIFMHNMTITDLDKMMKKVHWQGTDSEFFFRKIFIPYYRGLGDEAYKDGKFHEDLDNLVEFFCGYSNKFCFIMPDNRVIRYGTWVEESDRKENGEVAFHASNSGYKVVNYCTPSKGGRAAGAAGFCGGYEGYEGYDEYGYDGYGYGDDWYGRYGYYGNKHGGKGKKQRKSAKETRKMQSPDFDGKMLLKLAGVKGVCQLAMAHMVVENAITGRIIYSENAEEEEAEKAIRGLLPKCCEEGVLAAIREAYGELAHARDLGFDGKAVKTYVERFAESVAAAYEQPICKQEAPYAQLPTEWSVKNGVESACKKINVVARILNLAMNFSTVETEKVARCFVLDKDGINMEEYMVEDLIGFDTLAPDDAADALQMLLCYVNDCVDEFYTVAPQDDVRPETQSEIQDAVDKAEADAEKAERDENSESAADGSKLVNVATLEDAGKVGSAETETVGESDDVHTAVPTIPEVTGIKDGGEEAAKEAV